MLTYIYFVKCPNCEDEHFDFFNDAKEYAMSCLAQKPIITQTEVKRNDFGECIDSCDLGTVWSWEEMMKDVLAEQEPVAFLKADTLACKNSHDSEFDNSLATVPDNFRKPVPEDMTIKDLVEAMEENEDEVECTWCNELFSRDQCRKEVDLGWLCDRCQAAIMSRGEQLTFRENNYWEFLDDEEEDIMEERLTETFNPKDRVEFEYTNLRVFLQGPKRDVDDWDAVETDVNYTFIKNKEDVAVDIWENFIEESDVADVEGGLEALEDDTAWNNFLAKHFDDLLEKYYDKLLAYYRADAAEEYADTHSLGESAQKPFLEELEEPEAYRARLTDCPECGVAESFDHGTGICINCGFNI